MLARKVVDSRMPLPRDRICGCRISGIEPYLAGAKKAACVPIMNTVDMTMMMLRMSQS